MHQIFCVCVANFMITEANMALVAGVAAGISVITGAVALMTVSIVISLSLYRRHSMKQSQHSLEETEDNIL